MVINIMISHFKTKFFTSLDWVTKQGETTWLAITCLGLFYMFIISPPPPPVPQPFVHLAFQYSPLPFLPFSSQCSWNQTAFYILY